MFADANTSAAAPRGDLVLQQAGRTEFRLHLAEALGFEPFRHLGQRAAQTAGSVEKYGFFRHRRACRECENRKNS
jgi:hypothetical protein